MKYFHLHKKFAVVFYRYLLKIEIIGVSLQQDLMISQTFGAALQPLQHQQLPAEFTTIFSLNHTIYKNHFVKHGLAVCGSMRVCDTSLEPSWSPYERMIGAFRFARAARPQCAKM